MKGQDINIATARIMGLTKPPYYFDQFCFYAWNITFLDSSTLLFNNIPFIKVGDSAEEAEDFCNQLKENFDKAHIYEGNKVAIIFENSGNVIAIGSLGENLWIDVTDKFVKKTFKELNIDITTLKVY